MVGSAGNWKRKNMEHLSPSNIILLTIYGSGGEDGPVVTICHTKTQYWALSLLQTSDKTEESASAKLKARVGC